MYWGMVGDEVRAWRTLWASLKECGLPFVSEGFWEEEWFAWVFSFIAAVQVRENQGLLAACRAVARAQQASASYSPAFLICKVGVLTPNDREVVEMKQGCEVAACH